MGPRDPRNKSEAGKPEDDTSGGGRGYANSVEPTVRLNDRVLATVVSDLQVHTMVQGAVSFLMHAKMSSKGLVQVRARLCGLVD
jgi:hypothetical protein